MDLAQVEVLDRPILVFDEGSKDVHWDDDAGERTVVVHDHGAVDVLFEHEANRGDDGIVGAHRIDDARHDLGDGAIGRHRGAAARIGEIGHREHTGEPPAVVEHGRALDAGAVELLPRFGGTGVGAKEHDRFGHHLTDAERAEHRELGHASMIYSPVVRALPVVLAAALGGCARGASVPPSLLDDPCAGASAYDRPPGALDSVLVQADGREAAGEIRYLAMCVDGGAMLRAAGSALVDTRGTAARWVASTRGRHELTLVIEVETRETAKRKSQAFVARSSYVVDFGASEVVTGALVDDDPSGPAFRPRIDWHVRPRK